jgi:Flp pilus assembly protein TadD
MLPVGPWLLIPLGLGGLAVSAPLERRVEYVIWASFVPAYALAIAVFFVADRYRLPLLVPLCITGGAGLDALAGAISARRWRALSVAAVLSVALFALVNRREAVDTGVGEERTRMAERLIALGRYDEGEQWAARAEAAYARPGLMHFRVGQRLLMRDQSAAAIGHFQKALQFDPGQPEVEFLLGSALLDAERPAEAVPHLRNALAAGIRPDLAGYNLVRALGAAGKRDEAVAVLQTLHPADAADAGRWTALGELAMPLRDPMLAETFFRRAIAARSDFAPAHTDLAATLATLGRFPEAKSQVQQALAMDPNDGRAKHLLELLK